MDVALQALVNAIMLGSLYSLIAVGLTLIFSTLRIIQFAHGQVYMLGAFTVYFVYERAGVNFVAALIVAALAAGLLGVVLERAFFARLRGQDLPSMIVGLGLLLLLEGVALVAFGERDQYIANPVRGVVHLAGVSLPKIRLVLLGVAILLVVLLFVFLKWVREGRAMRAVAQDGDAASLQGINVSFINTLGFAIGSGMAAIAGGMLLTFGKVNPFIGGNMVITAFVIIILGGLGSVPGSVAGAFLLAAIESFGLTYWGEGARLVAFLLVMLILLFRPSGLMGRVTQ